MSMSSFPRHRSSSAATRSGSWHPTRRRCGRYPDGAFFEVEAIAEDAHFVVEVLTVVAVEALEQDLLG
jgi:hypothetical protein